ncbi:hypothetical protein [Sporomusa sphaeroides]|uniref:hypothetical protein n=1 Tax=Sporomusa sphaeroides TaxID=47679 RepID=UPI002C283DC6|nr:hypothetical protein [Sporomusa sphaeroides]HML32314.1 hypothetical protein [Sporomusa sphaeroides]
MGEVLTQSFSWRIAIENPNNQKLMSLIGILEGYLSKVTKNHFRLINSKSLDSITLCELGLIYKNSFSKNTGMNGVCWEHSVFHSIYHNHTYIQDLINTAINTLSKETTSERINAILWGSEKPTISLENIKSNIKDGEVIWTPSKEYDFKEYIDLIYNSFNSKTLKGTLPEHITGIWKTDLFVKKKSSNTWYAVTVKWNEYDLKYYPGLSIGIYFEPMNLLRQELNIVPIFNNNNNNMISFVKCAIPFAYNFGEHYTYMFRLVTNILSNINSNIKGTSFLDFPSSDEHHIFRSFYDNRNSPCLQVINHLKDTLKYYINTVKQNEIINATDRQIIIPKPNFTNDNEENYGIKIVPLGVC